MHTVQEVIANKADSVYSVAASSSVLDAAVLMNEQRIGSLIVLEDGAMAGILTERDILTRIVAVSEDPSTVRVADVMTTPVLTCTSKTTAAEARVVMRNQHIRHLPVIDDGRLIGMISIGDLNMVDNAELTQTIEYMEAYISGDVRR